MSATPNLREQINALITKAEHDIQHALQELHDTTGMIPESIDFEAIDVRTIGQYSGARIIEISRVELRAHT